MTDESSYRTRVTLLEKLKDRHDDAAWADFAYYYRSFIFNIARRMRLSEDDSNEIVQLVLLRSWDKLGTFQYSAEKGRFRGWLCRVAGNIIRNYIRDQKSRYVSLEDFKDENGHGGIDPFSQPEIEKIAEEEWEHYIPNLAWKNVSGRFDENTRRTYQMLLDGKSPEQIASELGISKSSVYVNKKRVKDRLTREARRLKAELG